MENINFNPDWLVNNNIVHFFTKSFGVIFSIMYLLFAIVIYKQTQVMNNTLATGRGRVILLVSFLQIFFALIILLLAIFFI